MKWDKQNRRSRKCPKCQVETDVFLANCFWCVECDVLFRPPIVDVIDKEGRIS